MCDSMGTNYTALLHSRLLLPIELSPIVCAPPERLWKGYGPDWGLQMDDPALDELADALYVVEWEGGGDNQHIYVGESAVEAGLGNYSKMLRNWGARVAGHLIGRMDRRASILEVGAGAGDSIIPVYKVVGDPKRIYATLYEPSETKRGVMEAKLNARGLRIGKDFDIVKAGSARDIDVADGLPAESQDMVLQIATVHHHRGRERSFRCANAVTRMGGHYISGDWHSHLWMHPAMVYQFLFKTMEWPRKAEGMEAFRKAYPNASGAPPVLGHYSLNEVTTFSRYWQAWNARRQREIAKGTFDPKDDFFAVEGHCPTDVYVKEFADAGFDTDTPSIAEMISEGIIHGNPDQIEPNHNLVNGMVAQKTRRAA